MAASLTAGPCPLPAAPEKPYRLRRRAGDGPGPGAAPSPFRSPPRAPPPPARSAPAPPRTARRPLLLRPLPPEGVSAVPRKLSRGDSGPERGPVAAAIGRRSRYPRRDAGPPSCPLQAARPARLGSARRPVRGGGGCWSFSPSFLASSRRGAQPAPLGRGDSGGSRARPWAGSVPCLTFSRGSWAGTCLTVGPTLLARPRCGCGMQGLSMEVAGAGWLLGPPGAGSGRGKEGCGRGLFVGRGGRWGWLRLALGLGREGAGVDERRVSLKTKEEPLKLSWRLVRWRQVWRGVWIPTDRPPVRRLLCPLAQSGLV